MIEQCGSISILDVITIAMIKQGKIRVMPTVPEILPHGVRFGGGNIHPFESIIFAPGYSQGLGNLIENFETISDVRGRPLHFGDATRISGLNFVGFRTSTTSALPDIALEAPRMRNAKP